MSERFHRLLHRIAGRLGVNSATAGNRWHSLLERIRHSRIYPLVIMVLAAISAGTGLYAFGPVLAAAVLVAPRRWWSIYAAACLGAVVGVLVLAGLVQAYGLPWVEALFPGVEESADWQGYTYWANRHGWLALAAIAALPLPQMPILILSALSHIALGKIALAILLGKLVKYGIYGAAVLAVLKVVHGGKDSGA